MTAPSPQAVETLFHQAAEAHPHFALGCAFADASGHMTVLAKGPRRKGGDARVATDAHWHIGSITKSVTATLVMKLVERGLLDLDTPIEEVLTQDAGQMHADWRDCTLRHLLSHSAGIQANPSRRQLLAKSSGDLTRDRREVLASFWTQPMRGKPGTFTYSNLGYMLAGLATEEVTGQAWSALVKSEIAEPLGLTSLGFGAPTGAGDPWGHSSILGFKRAVDPMGDGVTDNPPWLGPAGTLHSALPDLLSWGQMHLRAASGQEIEGFISPESARIMQAEILESYGLGWVIQSGNETIGPTVWHNGSNTMWYALLILSPVHDLTLALTTNVYQATRMDALAREMMTALIESGAGKD
ncbi:serine hydrolase [Thalassococcus sp. S3]|uniref:serine hydrolase domain-containing protein n=1 Tax=Thalassococcus sp. S3 TaxID=2017482 RepID=UPI001C2C01E8|nr:serine hydrolase domain-containing protein [Thalassococcus sp. S3]